MADDETYYYVDYNFYVEYDEYGKTGYVNGEPDVGAQTDRLPDEVTTVEEDGVTYYQFDTVFFEEVEDGVLMTDHVLYELPGGSLGEVASGWVENRLNHIFDFRENAIKEVFK